LEIFLRTFFWKTHLVWTFLEKILFQKEFFRGKNIFWIILVTKKTFFKKSLKKILNSFWKNFGSEKIFL
jgi:hypothetical protein